MSSRKDRAKREKRRMEAVFGADLAASGGRGALIAKQVFPVSPVIVPAAKPTPAYAAPVAPKPAPAPTPTYAAPVAAKPVPVYAAPVAPKPAVATPVYVPPTEPKPGLVKLPPITTIAPTSDAAYVPPSGGGTTYREPEPEIREAEVEPIMSAPVVNTKETPIETLAPAVPKSEQKAPLGIWARMGEGLANAILSLFGIKKSVAVFSGDPPLTRMQAAGSLVRRARNGDQNAMAIIDMTRQNAALGNVQAKLGQACIIDYIKKHPASAESEVAGEGNPLTVMQERDYSLAHSVQIADGPLLANARIRQALKKSPWTLYEKQAFVFGLDCSNDLMPIEDDRSPHQKAIRAGRTIGLARRWQAFRTRNVPLKKIDKMIAWELGD